MLWWRGLLPRIHGSLPAGRVLEIGPGFGRWTQHLLGLADHLTIVDLTERCIELCRRRFAGAPNLEAWSNDGESLAMVPDGSLDFDFSFDSLVHAEAPVLRAYVAQLAGKLKPGGTAFIHHSNLRALAPADGVIPAWVARRNWRGETMSAALFRQYCRESGMTCRSQEIINWVSRSRRADRHRIPGAGMPMTDALSTMVRPCLPGGQATRVYVNPHFVEEWRQLTDLAAVYGHGDVDGDSGEPRPVPAAAARATRVLRSEGVAGLAARVFAKTAAATDHVSSLARDRRIARQVRRREPILNALRAGRCPDCHATLSARRRCAACDVEFVFPPE
jgi:SAM-dependent methyltransferase